MATGCSVLTAPIWIEVTNYMHVPGVNVYNANISWGAPCGGVDSYTFYYDDGGGVCDNVTLASTITSHTVEDGQEIQIVTHRNDMKKCSPGITLKHYSNKLKGW